jgi:opacity protein-like surface antigen
MLKRNTFIGCFARAISRPLGHPRASLLLFSLVAWFGFAGTTHGQAVPTAEKTAGIDVFGTFTLTSPDYGLTKTTGVTEDAGFTVGGAYQMRKFFWGQPAAAVRYSYVTGSSVNETFIGGGGELRYRYHMLRPYITVLGGVGSLTYRASGYNDSGNTFLFGGGADYPVSPKFSARAEFTYSRVNITGFQNTQVGSISLNPWSINLGVVYHIK